MKNPTSRKQQLRKRANSFAAQTEYVQDAASPVTAASLAWEDGYRAAMRDARKVLKGAQATELRLPGNTCISVQRVGYAALWNWLRPLR